MFDTLYSVVQKNPKIGGKNALQRLKRLEKALTIPMTALDVVWKGAWGIVFVGGFVVLTAWMTGGLDRLEPIALGAGTTPRYPKTVEWFSPAPSPFDTRATRPDGSVDLIALRDQLQKAGVNWGSAMAIVQDVAHSYQHLILVDDPKMRAEILDDAHKANVELNLFLEEKGENMDHIFRAMDKKAMPWGDDLEKALQKDAYHQFSWRNAGIFPSIGQPGMKSMAERWNHIRDYNAFASKTGSPMWPTSQVVALGVNEGAWDDEQLLRRMREAGASSKVAAKILDEIETYLDLAETLPLAPLGVEDVQTIGKAYKWALEFDYEYADLLRARRAGDNLPSGLFSSLDGMLDGVPEDLRQRARREVVWEEKEWEKIQKDTARGYAPQKAPEGLDMNRAKAELERIAKEVGLRRLSLTNASFQSPENIWEIAKGLEQANTELQHITGWTGPVLGLNGRVELALREPTHLMADGVVLHVGDGRISMATGWGALAHEWFHALDMVAGQHALDVPLIYGLSTSEHNLRYARLPDVVEASKRLKNTLNETPSAWGEARKKGDQILDFSYFTNGTEMTASAFDSWLSSQPESLMLSTRYVDWKRVKEPQYVLDPQQFEGLTPIFENYFRSFDGMDWTGRSGKASARERKASVLFEARARKVRQNLDL